VSNIEQLSIWVCSIIAAVRPMSYLPSFRLSYPDGCFSEYRLRDKIVEFRTDAGRWRILEDADIQCCFALHNATDDWWPTITSCVKDSWTD
jgi:hypothetical protein